MCHPDQPRIAARGMRWWGHREDNIHAMTKRDNLCCRGKWPFNLEGGQSEFNWLEEGESKLVLLQ